MRRRTALLAALLALGLLAGCGGGFGNDESTGGAETTSRPSPRGRGGWSCRPPHDGFNPAQVYEDAAPGVVTIRSIFDNGAAEGSGFVLDSDGRIVTNAHVVTEDAIGGGERPEAKAVYVEFPDRNVVSAKIVGFDPFGDVALIEVDPAGLDLHPLALGNEQRPRRRPAGGGDRQPLRRAALALGRDHLGDRPLGGLADRIPDRGSDPDRRRDQSRQLGRPAARRRRQGDRHQPADPDRNRRQRRRRLRDPDLGGQALARPARAGRHGRIRLHRGLDPGPLPAARRKARPRRRLRRAARRSRQGRAGRRSRAPGGRRQDPLPGLPGHGRAAT